VQALDLDRDAEVGKVEVEAVFGPERWCNLHARIARCRRPDPDTIPSKDR
jgi:hypothetical protein